jgi:signal transduction histidine kinase
LRRSTYLLQQRTDLSPEVQEHLREMDRSAEALALPELPEQRLEPGCALGLRDAPLLDQVVLSEVERLRGVHPTVTLRADLDCSDCRVAMHEQWLRRLLRHLIHNAGKATASVERSRMVIIRAGADDVMAEVQVEDTGKGVRPEIEAMLFRRPIPHEGGKLGRGLLLVRFLAEQHGGSARLVWSRPGSGACFAFRIPLAQPRDT